MAELEPMDVDDINDNKENAFMPNNVLRGQENAEGLDSTEYHMKLRYSTTSLSSPMSKSYTVIADKNNDNTNNCNMTQSLNLTVTKSDTTFTGPKSLPLQTIPSEDADKTINVLKQLDSLISDSGDVTITVSKAIEDNENISLASSSSVTPEAVTPTKEVPKPMGSPILRGIQSVFNMFRASQSPVPPNDNEECDPEDKSSDNSVVDTENSITASTPLNIHKKSESISSRDSRDRENPVFNEKLEKDLEWNETTIIFSKEKYPIHKLLFQQSNAGTLPDSSTAGDISMASVNQSYEAMDVSYNNSGFNNKTLQGNNVTSTLNTENVQSNEITGSEKDESVFLDCETTLNESQAQNVDKSNSRTQDKTLNDTSFISMQSAETVTCTSDMAENLIVSESFVQENQVVNPTADIALKKTIDTVSHADSSSEGFDKESHEIVESQITQLANNNKMNPIDTDTNIKTNDAIQSQENNEYAILTNDNVKIENDVSSTESVQESHKVVIESQSSEKPDEDNKNPEVTDINTTVDEVIQCKVKIIDEQPTEANIINQFNVSSTESVQETHEIVNKCQMTTSPDNNEMKAAPTDKNINNDSAVGHQSISHEEPTEKEVIEQLVVKTEYEINQTENVLHNELAGPVCISESQTSPSMPDSDIDNTEVSSKDIHSSKIESLEIDKIETDQQPELTEAKPENCNLTVSLEIESLVSEDNVYKNMEGTSLPYSVNDITTQVTSKEDLVSSTQDALLVPAKHNIAAEADTTNDVLSFAAVVDITPDGSLIITTDDKETIEIPTTSEDISMVDADMLVPEDELDLANDAAAENNDKIQDENDANKSAAVTSQPSENLIQDTVIQKPNGDQCNEEVIMISESNSPYVSLGPEVAETESVKEDTITSPELNRTAPESPKITSAGYYNFNFNEINPFATRTRLSISPTRQVYIDKPINSPVVREIMESCPIISEELASTPMPNISDQKDCVLSEENTTILLSDKIVADKDDHAENCKPVPTQVLRDNTKESHTELKLTVTKNEAKDISTSEAPTVTSSPMPSESSQKLSAQITSSQFYSLDSSSCEMPSESSQELSAQITSSQFYSCEIGQPSNSSDAIETNESLQTSKSKSINNIQTPVEDFQQPAKQNDQKVESCDALSDNINKTVDSYIENPANTTVVHENASDLSLACSDDIDVTVREVHTEDEDTAEGPNIESQIDSKEDYFSDFVSVKRDCGTFDDLPPEAKDEAFEPIESAEMFIDAEAFDFLMSQNSSNEVISSGKESLFLKFDPLFSKRVNSDGVLDILSKIQKRQSTPKKLKQHQSIMDMSNEEKPGPSSGNRTFDVQGHDSTLNNTRSKPQLSDLDETLNEPYPKPTMIVTPVVPKNNMKTPSRGIRRSSGVNSPAIAVIDRLLSISANNSMGYDDSTVIHYNAEQEEADRALIELRDLVAVKELEVYQLKSEGKELKDRLFAMESQMENLDREGEKRMKAINALNEQLNEKDKINKSMKDVVEEYEKTIAGLISEIESDKKRNAEEKRQLIRDRDEQTAHLSNMEGAFSDLHSKYEKSKQIILSYKANEDAYKKNVEELEASLIKMEENYDALKEHATAQLDHANQELEKINKAHETEVVKLKAMIKRKDLHITSLEENIAQKMKANDELTAICDELINKVG